MNKFFLELYKMFFGTNISFLLIFESIFRTLFMYFYTLLNVRLMDKRSMGLLSPFEMIIIIALGTSVGDPMFYRNVPLLQGMLVISTIVFVERFLTNITTSSPIFEKVINGKPILIIRNGILQKKEMQKQHITKNELYSILRMHGVKNISGIELAYLEPSGSVSVIKKDSSKNFQISSSNNKNKF